MTYSCAYWRGGASTLEEAQEAKLELVCTKLALQEGERVLDVGCGWGSFAIHAAKRHGVHVTGITLSEPQAARARERAAEAGVADQVDIRVMDYRELRGERFDAIASIGMVEHVGVVNIDEYARTLAALLGPGGRLLNHGIARLRHGESEAGPFSERYVFPDAAPLHLSRIQLSLEAAGFETRPRRGAARGLRAHAARVDQEPRGQPRRGPAAGRSRAHARVGGLPARRPARVRDRLHLDLPGPRDPALTARNVPGTFLAVRSGGRR